MNIQEIFTEAQQPRVKSSPPKITTLLPSMSIWEKPSSEYQKKLKSLSVKINKNCGGFLQEIRSSGHWPWRGLGYSPGGAFLGNTPRYRPPKDSDPTLQAIFDRMLAEMGFKALRSNSIFVTGDSDLAMDYGSLYVIIPWDSSDFTWSARKKYHDLILGLLRDIPSATIKPAARASARAELKKMNSSQSQLSRLTRLSLENLLEPVVDGRLPSAESWSANVGKLPPEWSKNYPRVEDLVTWDLAVAQTKLKLSRENFSQALRSGGEILIHGKYYGLHEVVFNEMREQKLL